jgi:hypothetical protein
MQIFSLVINSQPGAVPLVLTHLFCDPLESYLSSLLVYLFIDEVEGVSSHYGLTSAK